LEQPTPTGADLLESLRQRTRQVGLALHTRQEYLESAEALVDRANVPGSWTPDLHRQIQTCFDDLKERYAAIAEEVAALEAGYGWILTRLYHHSRQVEPRLQGREEYHLEWCAKPLVGGSWSAERRLALWVVLGQPGWRDERISMTLRYLRVAVKEEHFRLLQEVEFQESVGDLSLDDGPRLEGEPAVNPAQDVEDDHDFDALLEGALGNRPNAKRGKEILALRDLRWTLEEIEEVYPDVRAVVKQIQRNTRQRLVLVRKMMA
jgi:hypothetical protein